jgi:hypothetical protein
MLGDGDVIDELDLLDPTCELDQPTVASSNPVGAKIHICLHPNYQVDQLSASSTRHGLLLPLCLARSLVLTFS